MQQLTLFDYSQLDIETRDVVQQRTTEIKALMRRTAQDIIEIGQKLIEVKDRLGHGNFGPWLKIEFEFSEDAARKFMRVAEKFKTINFLDLTIAPSALYLLAADNTPEPIRQEMVERAQNGEAITYSTVRESIEVNKLVDPIVVYSGNQPVQKTVDEYIQLEREESTQDTHLDAALADESKPVCQSCGQVYDGPRCPDCHKPDPIPSPLAVHYSSETPEWYTPEHIIERVIQVLGEIDLDPCSNPGEPNVQAREHYTQEDDGLSKPWRGRVYMNPPYGREIKEWVNYLVAEYEAGRTYEAIALVPARTDTEWFRVLEAFPRCFVYGRLVFSGYDNSAPFPSMAVYLGSNGDSFKAAFRNLGGIYRLDE